ncbi:PDZ domain-containing protein [Desulfonema magnum]|uniref:PDZ domain-containing protein n=1 Tax=Desulfonema magnum TaxID=45655 RepID=A0A975BQH7_9BACT|nr:PDZ domain-containing protein [Desulfonema magnum]QTA89523.1 PDZ domain-containing protein [Desulfonema magnum]
MNKRLLHNSIFFIGFLILSLSVPATQSLSVEEKSEKFGGLGMVVAQIFDQEVENHLGSLVVLGVLDGKPAASHGIQKGDIITHIDGELTKGMMFEDLILKKLRGPIGSKAALTVSRHGEKTPLNFNLTRIEIKYTPEKKAD